MWMENETSRVQVCRHIRSQESFYSNTPLKEDQFHSGVYWCGLSGEGMGPDGQCAGTGECSATRECFED